ncbi:hypothetical protein VTP01DRAFT_3429 [Rhizomucor pusillus]|uniref:uncharacterized protein n=1 Tax=Rhizomucor pusillus TaxID=4840 RepID=UPI00374379F0
MSVHSLRQPDVIALTALTTPDVHSRPTVTSTALFSNKYKQPTAVLISLERLFLQSLNNSLLIVAVYVKTRTCYRNIGDPQHSTQNNRGR